MRDRLTFLRNGEKVTVADFDPQTTLLDYLRLTERKTGTKEGCNEGDCGACTVALGKIRSGKLSYEPVNACILLLGQVEGCDVITVDDLAGGGKLHAVQQAMVDLHGSQCGFCTPGFVMSLFTLHHSGKKADRSAVNDWLAGNLCRCTGYRPIADAALKTTGKKPSDALAARWKKTEKALLSMQGDDLFAGTLESFFAAPGSVKALAALCAEHPDAVILSGATDVGLWITKQMRQLPKIIYTGRAAGFDAIRESSRQIVIGAGATYTQAFDTLASLGADIGEVLRRLGSRHVRASGTVGGNIANGSPIGDTPPMLIALGASLELQHGSGKRTLSLEDFFIDYGKQDRKPGELVTKVIVPKPGRKQHFKAWKISKRFDQDISAVLFAALFTVEKGRIASARIACGGMAGTPKHAKHAEAAIAGARLDDPATWARARAAFEKDYTPMTDMRASSGYRMEIVKNLLTKALTELAAETGTGEGAATRVLATGEAV
ncbi:MAG: xanthine dehydrogenase small subunit [Nitratireductor sp.]|nr:xanthine dehydrogenase small subunit [Nitratireductor sp.]